jgi:hypothetical protein
VENTIREKFSTVSYYFHADDTEVGFDCSYDEEERDGGCKFDSELPFYADKSYDDKFDEFKVHSNELLHEDYDYDQHIICEHFHDSF